MSWSPRNLYNLWRRSVGGLVRDSVWKQTGAQTIFQQRWKSKALVRGYHGDFINEKIFKRWYLPATLPDVRPRAKVSIEDSNTFKWAKKDSAASREIKRADEIDSKGLAPVGSLMFSEVERRIDVVIFRACFAHSVYEARRMVVHGDVLLNGKKHQNANTRLAPGDMVSVDPKAIRFLQADSLNEGLEEEKLAKEEEKSESVSKDETSETGATPEPPTPEPPKLPSLKLALNSWKKPGYTPFNLPPYAAPFIFIPAYLEPSFSTCSVIYLRHPTARPGYSEIPTPWHADGEIVRLAWEWYSRMRPRMRSKSQLARMPENRQ
ncbi:hypothetical protein NLI96_g7613 [Meripilus lineatus]|uniref:RNA-binding S4 domain-containing protein n=1 Tax=Meripilus lineatus TaxID=2056292 RepID=A0AAD5YCS7_9APHY|nr:hypothetical protein NLI96_g7613 [Physisporinus lineatus]